VLSGCRILDLRSIMHCLIEYRIQFIICWCAIYTNYALANKIMHYFSERDNN